jgi:prophage tail gpP-like protein
VADTDREEIVVYGKKKRAKGVQLYVGENIYSRWTSIDITRSIETIAGTFELSLTEKVGGKKDLASIQPGAACRVTVDGETVITGHVDETGATYDKDSHAISVKGRDATGDLVDCSAPFEGADLLGQDPLAIIKRICSPFGINVRSEVSALTPLQQYTIEPGATCFDVISALSAYAAVLPVSDGMGGLVLTRAGTGPSYSAVQLGVNIERGQGRFSAKERFSDYTVLGQTKADGLFDPAKAYTMVGRAKDPGVNRYRPLVIMANFLAADDSAYQLRATWEMAVRAGRAFRENITVKGWRDDAGTLWKPNGTLKVQDEFVGFNSTLVIAAVKYALDENGGASTVLSVTRRQAFSLIQQPLGSNYIDPGSGSPRLFPIPSSKGGQL